MCNFSWPEEAEEADEAEEMDVSGEPGGVRNFPRTLSQTSGLVVV
tara:strand:- start:102 stop:236 length:135 start_codon:yes stop_codon:yes gene_type:complete